MENLLHQSIVEFFYNLVLKVYFSHPFMPTFITNLSKNVKQGHNWKKQKKRRQGVQQGEIEW